MINLSSDIKPIKDMYKFLTDDTVSSFLDNVLYTLNREKIIQSFNNFLNHQSDINCFKDLSNHLSGLVNECIDYIIKDGKLTSYIQEFTSLNIKLNNLTCFFTDTSDSSSFLRDYKILSLLLESSFSLNEQIILNRILVLKIVEILKLPSSYEEESVSWRYEEAYRDYLSNYKDLDNDSYSFRQCNLNKDK